MSQRPNMIKLSDILSADRVFLGLPPMKKRELLGEMAHRLHELGEIEDEAAIAERLVKREELISTGVRQGFAFPHAFTPQVEWLSLSIGVIPEGTDYEALDGEPVHVVFLMLGPPSRQDLHLRALARLSRITAEEGMMECLRGASEPQQIVDLLNEADRAFDGSPLRR